MDKKTIVIAFGGVSPEHEVSVLTAMQAIDALDSDKYRKIPLYISKSGRWFTGEHLLKLENYKDLDRLTEKSTPCIFAHNEYGSPVIQELNPGLFSRNRTWAVDVALIAFHGSDGENGGFQGVCEMFNIPYTGSGVLASSVGMDKVTAKSLCRAHDIPVVEDVQFREKDWGSDSGTIRKKIERLGYPVVVKPVHLGSSIGVSVVEHEPELSGAVELAFRYDDHLLVEKAVQPLIEINCSVIGEGYSCKTSVCERPLGKASLLSFSDKYMSDSGGGKGMASADREIPADISDQLTENIQKMSQKVFGVFRGSGLARLDFLVNGQTDEFYFNEINTIPGSFSFYLWNESGKRFGDILEELIVLALSRHNSKTGRVQSYETNLLSQKAVKGLKGLKAGDS